MEAVFQIRCALGKKYFEQLQRLVHNLKGLVANLATTEMYSAEIALGKLTKNGSSAVLVETLSKLPHIQKLLTFSNHHPGFYLC
jgi:hypothetical protein